MKEGLYIKGVKAVLFPADFIVDTYFLLTKKDVFYEAGRKFFDDTHVKRLTDVFDFLYDFGWGKFQIVWYSKERIIIKGISVFAKQLKKYYGVQKQPVDDFIRGILDAWAEENRLKIRFKEVECVAMGSEKCVFIGEIIKRPKHSLVELQQRIRGDIF